jgi:trans-aconitate methyltransferase
VNAANPIDLLFEGMEKLGPGSDDETRRMLRRLPSKRFDVTIDAGCGAGRQTMVLVDELGTLVHAIDTYQPFLQILRRRAGQANVDHLVQTHCMDIKRR